MEKALEIPHPYSPRDLHFPGYVLVLLPPSTIICVYIAASLLVPAFIWVISGKEYSSSDAAWDSNIVSNVLHASVCSIVGSSLWCEFLTAYVEGDHFAASTWYYYAYYLFTNAPWLVIPSLTVIRCWKKACASSVTQGRSKAKSG